MMKGYERKRTKIVTIGEIKIGGGNPVSVQSMCNTNTADVAATLAQLHALQAAGAEIGRLAVPDQEAADALPAISQAKPAASGGGYPF